MRNGKEQNELPWGWVANNRDFTGKIETEFHYFMQRWLDSAKAAPQEQLEALKSFVQYLKDAKKLCNKMGGLYAIWFEQMIANDQYITKRENELKDLEENFDTDREIFVLKPQLETMLLSAIQKQPGILQTELCKSFPVDMKTIIQDELYHLVLSKKIRKEKIGNRISFYLN